VGIICVSVEFDRLCSYSIYVMRTRKPLKKDKKIVAAVPKDVERPRYPSEDLQPLLQYEPGRAPYLRERWMRQSTVYMRAFLAEGLSREEIKERLDVKDKVYDEIEMRLLESEGAKFTSMGTAQRYYHYMLRNEQFIRELDQFTRLHMEDDPRKSGVVGAIKAKAQLTENLMKMGQDLGIISKRAKEIRVLGEINLVTLPNDEIQKLYEERMSWFQSVMQGTPSLPPAYNNILKRAVEGNHGNSESDENKEEEEEVIEAEYEERDSV
jgi:hypothetical protein